jgi:hypothetical protein
MARNKLVAVNASNEGQSNGYSQKQYGVLPNQAGNVISICVHPGKLPSTIW